VSGISLSGLEPFRLLASTPVGGFALQNGTPTVFTWTAPNDGNNHRVLVFASLGVSSAQTGGAVTVQITDPSGNVGTHTLYAGGLGTGSSTGPGEFSMIVKPGSTVTVAQSSAQTLGAATLYAELWGS
jgi:hypothetical protein